MTTQTLLRVVLIVKLNLPRLTSQLSLNRRFTVPRPQNVRVNSHVLNSTLLLLISVVSTQPMKRPAVVTLTIRHHQVISLRRRFRSIPMTHRYQIRSGLSPLNVHTIVAVHNIQGVTTHMARANQSSTKPLTSRVLRTPRASSYRGDTLVRIGPPLLSQSVRHVPQAPSHHTK